MTAEDNSIIMSRFNVILTLLNQELAGLTCSTVAHLFTGVFSTVEKRSAHTATLDNGSLATAHWLNGLTTDAGLCYKGRALWTRSRMTQAEEGRHNDQLWILT